MTRFLSRICCAGLVLLWGCAAPSGQSARRIAEPAIAAAYIPLARSMALGLERAAGAAMVIAPGVAVTNGHNRNLLDPAQVIGEARDYDLLFFRTGQKAVLPATADPAPGLAVTAYGQDISGGLRLAHGAVRQVVTCAGCVQPAYFTFAGDAGPGFSGGPVIDASGRLIGITFGFKDEGGKRLIYAYDMARVRAEFSGVEKRLPQDRN